MCKFFFTFDKKMKFFITNASFNQYVIARRYARFFDCNLSYLFAKLAHFLRQLSNCNFPLHHNIHNPAGDDDDFLDRVAGEVLRRVFVREDEFLNLVFRSVFRALERETHLAVELHRVLLRVLHEVRFVANGPLGIYYKLADG